MAKTWKDIFKTEIDEWISDTVAEDSKTTTRINLFTYVQDGDMLLERAAKHAGMSTDDFIDSMREVGYRVPEGTKYIS